MKTTMTIKIVGFAIWLAVISVSLITSGCVLSDYGPRYKGLSYPSQPHYKLNIIVLNPMDLQPNASFRLRLDMPGRKRDRLLFRYREGELWLIKETVAEQIGLKTGLVELIYDEKEYEALVFSGIPIPLDYKDIQVYTSVFTPGSRQSSYSFNGKKINIIPVQNETYTIVYRFDDIKRRYSSIHFLYTPYVNYSWGSSWIEDDISYGTVTDIDNNVYQTVVIGNQEWMAENLRVTRDASGNNITRYCYDDDPVWCDLYGGLYTWNTVMNGQSSSSSNPGSVQGICPTGWHVPSDAEWTQLVQYVVSQSFINNRYDPNLAGNALKSCLQVGSPLEGCNTSEHPRWNSHSTDYGLDVFGFSALPGGFRWSDWGFGDLGSYGHWWSSTEYSSPYAWRWSMRHNYGNVACYYYAKSLSFSLRCVRDLD